MAEKWEGEKLRVTLDFETRSKVDLTKVGAWVYAEHESTRVLCLAYKIGETETKIWRWHEEDPPPQDLFAAISQGATLEAHTSFFELCIWEHVCVPRMGWPKVKRIQWRCSAAICAAHSLPRKLGEAGAALGLDIQKDNAGHGIMLKLSKMHKPTRKFPSIWREDPEDLEKLYQYCITDVEAEHAISKRLPKLSGKEQRLWLLDQEINCRGIAIDKNLVLSAIKIAKGMAVELNAKAEKISNGAFTAVSEREKVQEWSLSKMGYELEKYTKPYIAEVLQDETLPKEVRKVLEIRRILGKVSVAKYPTLNAVTGEDGHAHGLLMYHGANTGRWSGKFFQPQNIPRGSISDVEDCIDTIKWKDKDLMDRMYDNVMEALSSCIRGALVPSEGKEFYVADYAAIEARVLLWLARDKAGIEEFKKFDNEKDSVARKLLEPYRLMAGEIYNKPATDIVSSERQLGKTIILGGGFGMGPPKFVETCESWGVPLENAVTRASLLGEIEYRRKKAVSKNSSKTERMLADNISYLLENESRYDDEEIKEGLLEYGVTPELAIARHTIMAYRKKYSAVVDLWKETEETAILAIRTPEETFEQLNGITWRVTDGFLYCKLPSGRRLAYYAPELKKKKTPWGEVRDSIRFMGVNSVTRKWERQSTYSGRLVENLTQATARDLMAEAMPEIEKKGYQIVLSVHDELISEKEIGKGNLAEYEALMATTPQWAVGCPVVAEGWVGNRYKKG